MKKNLLKGLLFVLSLSLLATLPLHISAQETYTITETELTQLEQNLQTLKQHNEKKQALLMAQQNQLQEAKSELTKANKQIEKLQVLNEKTQKSLASANQYLSEYEKETQAKIKSEKRQKHLWQLATVVMAVIAITK